MFYFVIILTSVVLVAMYYMWVLDRHDKLNDRVLLAKDSSFHQLNEVNPDKEGLANGEKLTSTNDKIQFPTLNSKFSLVEGLVVLIQPPPPPSSTAYFQNLYLPLTQRARPQGARVETDQTAL